jgi:hypothetical protein
MNEFFKDPNTEAAPTDPKAPTDQEIREQIQAEVFEGKPAKFDDDVVDTPVQSDTSTEEDLVDVDTDEASSDDSATAPDPELTPAEAPPLSPEMQAIVDSVNKLTSSITGMESRVRKTESRIGNLTHEFSVARDAADSQAKAPTPEEMAEAAKDEKAWEDLKTDFPSWATAIKSKITAQAKQFVSVEDFEALRQSVAEVPSVDTNQLETRLVGLIHPDWKQITQSPDYASWLKTQSEDLKFKAYKGTTAEEAIDVFNQFKSSKATPAATGPSEVEQIKDQRAERLAASTTTTTKHKTIKQKSQADMTETELRADIAKKVFAT